jgi:UDP-glucose 4-epimerase
MTRVSQIARDELPADASQEDKDACTVDVVKGDMRDAKVLDGIFADYKQKGDAIWSVILVAALKAVGESGEIPIE